MFLNNAIMRKSVKHRPICACIGAAGANRTGNLPTIVPVQKIRNKL